MNAAADRLDDSFPHGTVDGYKAGCRGNVCPAGDEYGLSCKRANQLHAGDYRYQKLVKRRLKPAEIALELGLIPENPSAVVVPTKKAQPKPPAPTSPAQPLAERSHDPSDTTLAPAGEVAAATPTEASAEGEGMGHPKTPPTPAPAVPSQSTIRAWARAIGIDVNAKGSVRTDVADAYRAAHASPAPVATAADLDAWADDHPEDPIEHITDAIDQLRHRIDMPTPEPIAIDENALPDAAPADPDPGTEVTTPAEFAARWNRLTDDERMAWITGMRVARDGYERCRVEDHATLERLRDTRPDWATVATTEDLGHAIAQRNQARRFAEHSLAELAHLAAREEAALTLALQKWADAASDRDTLAHKVAALSAELATVRDIETQLSEAYAEIRALAGIAGERDDFAAQLTRMSALIGAQQDEIERQRQVIEAAATARRSTYRDVLRIGRAR